MPYNPTDPNNPDALTRPYANIDYTTQSRRLTFRVRSDDWSIFASLYPVPSSIEASLTTLIHGIANTFRDAGITSWSPNNQRAFISHIRRCAAVGLTRDAVPRYDTRESSRVGGTTPPTEEEPGEVDVEADGGYRY